jgi:hypothetical protein
VAKNTLLVMALRQWEQLLGTREVLGSQWALLVWQQVRMQKQLGQLHLGGVAQGQRRHSVEHMQLELQLEGQPMRL